MNWKIFFSLNFSKSLGYDEVSFNVIKKCFRSLDKPLLHRFNVLLQNGIFPNELKIAWVTPVFRYGSDSGLGNYRPVSVLPCFSKILEKTMHKRPCKHLSGNNILYRKQFDFQQKHSIEHVIMQLVDQMNCSFKKNPDTLGIFIDLRNFYWN